jgi:choline monooxygenase
MHEGPVNRWSIDIDPDIRQASTLPGAVYSDPTWFDRQKEQVLARTWHFAGDEAEVAEPGAVLPFSLLAGCLDEPLLFARRQDGVLHCLSNVCTHRGNLVVAARGQCTVLRCRYHGRRFALDGRLLSSPEFEGARDFPSAADDLAPVPLGRFAGLLFTGLEPAMPFADLVRPVMERLQGWYPLDRLAPEAGAARDYEVAAPWALYCDNYLEGFHIPYVHAGLATSVVYATYRTETFRFASVQVAEAAPGEPCLEPPRDHPDHGQRVAAYYFWLFPATMLNFYPWGLSLNAVRPLGRDRTQVIFRSYVAEPELRERGAGSALDRVEAEDEAVVEQVAHGVKSRLYARGRYSPARERGVHHFHRLLAEFLAGNAGRTAGGA